MIRREWKKIGDILKNYSMIVSIRGKVVDVNNDEYTTKKGDTVKQKVISILNKEEGIMAEGALVKIVVPRNEEYQEGDDFDGLIEVSYTGTQFQAGFQRIKLAEAKKL